MFTLALYKNTGTQGKVVGAKVPHCSQGTRHSSETGAGKCRCEAKDRRICLTGHTVLWSYETYLNNFRFNEALREDQIPQVYTSSFL